MGCTLLSFFSEFHHQTDLIRMTHANQRLNGKLVPFGDNMSVAKGVEPWISCRQVRNVCVLNMAYLKAREGIACFLATNMLCLTAQWFDLGPDSHELSI